MLEVLILQYEIRLPASKTRNKSTNQFIVMFFTKYFDIPLTQLNNFVTQATQRDI